MNAPELKRLQSKAAQSSQQAAEHDRAGAMPDKVQHRPSVLLVDPAEERCQAFDASVVVAALPERRLGILLHVAPRGSAQRLARAGLEQEIAEETSGPPSLGRGQRTESFIEESQARSIRWKLEIRCGQRRRFAARWRSGWPRRPAC